MKQYLQNHLVYSKTYGCKVGFFFPSRHFAGSVKFIKFCLSISFSDKAHAMVDNAIDKTFPNVDGRLMELMHILPGIYCATI